MKQKNPLPKEKSCSSSRESGAEGALEPGKELSVAARSQRSVGRDAGGSRCDSEMLRMSTSTRSIRMSESRVELLPSRSEVVKSENLFAQALRLLDLDHWYWRM